MTTNSATRTQSIFIFLKFDSGASARGILKKKNEKQDIENLLEREDFPCQINDFINLTYQLERKKNIKNFF